MSPELTDFLSKLAEKLGTTTEQLWQTLLKQVPIEIELNLLWQKLSYVFIFLTVLSFIASVKATYKDDFVEASPLWLSFIILFITSAVTYTITYTTLLTLQNNPEFWALQQILK